VVDKDRMQDYWVGLLTAVAVLHEGAGESSLVPFEDMLDKYTISPRQRRVTLVVLAAMAEEWEREMQEEE
jgi:hypothetical protein